jgi:hypothetical protein
LVNGLTAELATWRSGKSSSMGSKQLWIKPDIFRRSLIVRASCKTP